MIWYAVLSRRGVINVADNLGRMTTGPRSVTRFENNVMCSSNLTKICLPERAQLVHSTDARNSKDEKFAYFVSFWRRTLRSCRGS